MKKGVILSKPYNCTICCVAEITCMHLIKIDFGKKNHNEEN